MTIQRKLFLGLMLVLLLFSLIIAFINFQFSKDNLYVLEKTKLVGDLELGYRYLDAVIPGDWAVRDGLLYKGNVKMNENYEVIDEIGKLMTAAAEEVSASAEEQAATVEEITASYQSLTEVIAEQNRLVTRFQV